MLFVSDDVMEFHEAAYKSNKYTGQVFVSILGSIWPGIKVSKIVMLQFFV